MGNTWPSTYKYYEIGLLSGDFMGILNKVEDNCEWAIVFDRSDDDIYGHRYQVYVNGTKVEDTATFSAAERAIQKYLSGQLQPPRC